MALIGLILATINPLTSGIRSRCRMRLLCLPMISSKLQMWILLQFRFTSVFNSCSIRLEQRITLSWQPPSRNFKSAHWAAKSERGWVQSRKEFFAG